MRNGKQLFSILVLVVLAVLLGSCINDPKMSYQGKLTNAAGVPVPDGNYNVTFRLYRSGIVPPYDPVVVWEETQDVPVAGGLFNVALGSVTPLTPSLFINPLSLGIEVNGDGEMTPRQPLYGAPYAMTLVNGAAMGGVVNMDAQYPGMFNVANLGTGFGIGVRTYGKAGLGIDGVNQADYGIMIDKVDHGAIITNTAGTGIYVTSSGGATNDRWAVTGRHSQDQGDGLFGWATGAGDTATGLTARSNVGRGVYAWSDKDTQYAGYFDNPIYVNGGCTGCTMRYVARNSSDGTLRPGAAVSAAGVEVGVADMAGPVMKVAPAVPGQAVLGVVVGRTTMTVADGSLPDVKAGAQFGPVEGPADPGDYLVIVVHGPAQVQVDPAATVAAGSLVYLGGRGVTTAASGPAIGMALDAVDADGLVWVLVGFH